MGFSLLLKLTSYLSWIPVSALHLIGELGEVMDLKNTNANANAGILLGVQVLSIGEVAKSVS